jgi:CheY-like chemotaxis protein
MQSTILIVDDSRMVREIYRQKLAQEKFRVLVATGGLEALQVLSQETPDLILLDLLMPDIDGFQILATLKRQQRLKDVPVMVFTSKSQGSDVQKALDLGAVDCIPKSTTPPNEVVRLVSRPWTRIASLGGAIGWASILRSMTLPCFLPISDSRASGARPAEQLCTSSSRRRMTAGRPSWFAASARSPMAARRHRPARSAWRSAPRSRLPGRRTPWRLQRHNSPLPAPGTPIAGDSVRASCALSRTRARIPAGSLG